MKNLGVRSVPKCRFRLDKVLGYVQLILSVSIPILLLLLILPVKVRF
jgi:hypothetical protein